MSWCLASATRSSGWRRERERAGLVGVVVRGSRSAHRADGAERVHRRRDHAPRPHDRRRARSPRPVGRGLLRERPSRPRAPRVVVHDLRPRWRRRRAVPLLDRVADRGDLRVCWVPEGDRLPQRHSARVLRRHQWSGGGRAEGRAGGAACPRRSGRSRARGERVQSRRADRARVRPHGRVADRGSERSRRRRAGPRVGRARRRRGGRCCSMSVGSRRTSGSTI